jgi:hypothetical protein
MVWFVECEKRYLNWNTNEVFWKFTTQQVANPTIAQMWKDQPEDYRNVKLYRAELEKE